MQSEGVHHSVVGAPEASDTRAVAWGDLPETVRHSLSALPKDAWGDVVVTYSKSDLLKDAAELVVVFSRVWEKSRAAEDFRDRPVTSEDRAQFRKSFENALRMIAENIIQLGTRARLIGELQRAQELLSFRAPEEWQKHWTRKVARAANAGGSPEAAPKKTVHGKQSPRPAQQPRRETAKPPILIIPAVAQ